MHDRTPQLLRGAVAFVGDEIPPRTAHLVFLRSPHAHAAFSLTNLDRVAALPGVIGLMTGEELAAAGTGDLPVRVRFQAPEGGPMYTPPYPLLARGKVRHVGEAVLAILAETRMDALAALDAVEIDYAPLPAAATLEEALAGDRPPIWEAMAGNVLFSERRGDWDGIDAALAVASHRTRLVMRVSRVTAAPLETRRALAVPDGDGVVLHVPSQAPHTLRRILAEQVLRWPLAQLRVVVPAVGGGFGMKGSIYPEYAVAAHAARQWQRPVCWISDRSEAMASDHQGRDAIAEVEIGLDEQARLTAIRWRLTGSIGAYPAFSGPLPLVNNLWGITGLYRVPLVAVEARGVITNAPPTAPYRGAGRPEATLSIERTLDVAARELGIDPWELRRRNLADRDAFPLRTALGLEVDSADPHAVLDRLEALCDRAGFAGRRERARRDGRLRGLGLACFMEVAAGPPGNPQTEAMRLTLAAPDRLVIESGTVDTGQGHGPLTAMLVERALAGAPVTIDFRFGDTGALDQGTGTFGSRSAIMLGLLVGQGAERIIERLRATAAEALEVDAGDVTYSQAEFGVAGTDLRLDFSTVAARHISRHGPLIEELVEAPLDATFPNGAHAAEVEIDPDTGAMQLIGYWAVDDVGNPLDPPRIAAQIHGGVAQGYGQAAGEEIAFEEGSGQLISGSFMDYAMPRAGDLPMIVADDVSVPSRNNPLGVKGVGEAGTVGALASIVNAVHDALAGTGVRHVDMPLKPERIWRAIQAARR